MSLRRCSPAPAPSCVEPAGCPPVGSLFPTFAPVRSSLSPCCKHLGSGRGQNPPVGSQCGMHLHPASRIPHPASLRAAGQAEWGRILLTHTTGKTVVSFRAQSCRYLGHNLRFGEVSRKLPSNCSGHRIRPRSARATWLVSVPPLSSIGHPARVGLLTYLSVCRIRLHEFTYFRTHSKCKNTKERERKKKKIIEVLKTQCS